MFLPRPLYPMIARVRIAKTAIAAEHMRYAFFDRIVLAVPICVSGADIYNRAPRRLASLHRLLVENQGSNDESRHAQGPYHRPPHCQSKKAQKMAVSFLISIKVLDFARRLPKIADHIKCLT
jgi:hypothetical protein